ncbi:MAG: hypothetical protein H0V17_04215 [Deltaproteobacteria bacterium]|nr:hypothetical protein [Deltaproteobacteria bacterium]
MSVLLAAGVLTVTWCLLLVYVARIAQSRGRSIVVWTLIAAGAGVLGTVTGFLLMDKMIGATSEVDPSMLVTAVAIFMPLILLIVPMVVVGSMVQREPIKITAHGSWPVAFLGKGDGSIAVDGGQIRVDMANTTRVLAPQQLQRVEADGECVRLTLADEELVVLPMGKPATPAGRRQQSLVLAKRLRHANSLH